jgi:hypothetical protein
VAVTVSGGSSDVVMMLVTVEPSSVTTTVLGTGGVYVAVVTLTVTKVETLVKVVVSVESNEDVNVVVGMDRLLCVTVVVCCGTAEEGKELAARAAC